MFQLKLKHMQLVKAGEFATAKKLLQFMQDKQILLGLSDTDYNLEIILEKCNFVNHTTGGGCWRRFYLRNNKY